MPQGKIFEKLADILVEEGVCREDIEITSYLTDLELSTEEIDVLITTIEKKFDIEQIPDSIADRFQSVFDIVQYLQPLVGN